MDRIKRYWLSPLKTAAIFEERRQRSHQQATGKNLSRQCGLILSYMLTQHTESNNHLMSRQEAPFHCLPSFSDTPDLGVERH